MRFFARSYIMKCVSTAHSAPLSPHLYVLEITIGTLVYILSERTKISTCRAQILSDPSVYCRLHKWAPLRSAAGAPLLLHHSTLMGQIPSAVAAADAAAAISVSELPGKLILFLHGVIFSRSLVVLLNHILSPQLVRNITITTFY